MSKRPPSITVISWIYLISGAVGLFHHGAELAESRWFQLETAWILGVRLLAVVAGLFMLRGLNWARWLAITWLGYHVILSAFHSLLEVVVHGLLFLVFAYLLFRPPASQYFRRTSGNS